jgi:large subunit ribosomal protein L24
MAETRIKIKKGDTVMINAGKGKKGKVLRVLREAGKLVVEGVGEVKKRRRPRKAGEKGQVVTMTTPVHASNVSLFCSSCGKGVRVGSKIDGDKKLRVCTKCKKEI